MVLHHWNESRTQPLTEYYIHVGYDSLARSEKLILLDGVLQKPDYATAASPRADGFFPVNKGSLYTFLLPKPIR